MKNYPDSLFNLLKNCYINSKINKDSPFDILHSILAYDLTMYHIQKKYTNSYIPWICENYVFKHKDISLSVKEVIESLWLDFLKENEIKLSNLLLCSKFKNKIHEIFK